MAKQKRIHDLAKELGIESKVIIKKCLDEGVPAELVKNHMSALSVGLEASIREWFAGVTPTAASEAGSAEGGTRKPAARRKKASGAEAASGPAAVKAEAAESGSSPEGGVAAAVAVAERVGQASAEVPALSASSTAVVSAPAEARTEPESKADSSSAVQAKPAATVATPTKPPAAPPRPAATVTPAPINVPTRPAVVKPVGQKLEVKAPVQLSGPKVVRVEAPEHVEPPRPRRAAPPGSAPVLPPREDRPGRVTADLDEERGRSPRRGPGQAGAKRSTGQGIPVRRRGLSGDAWQPGGAVSEQDLIEREERIARAGGFLKKRRKEMERATPAAKAESPAVAGKVRIASPFTIKDLSAATGVKAADIVKRLFLQGVMATINSGIDPVKAQEIMLDFNIDLEVTEAKTAEEVVSEQFANRRMVDERPRGPVITILGHVDHGKTTLLDRIRNTNVAAGEAGGITQRTSAFKVPLTIDGVTKELVFLDTPGHEAFTGMRARGARITDIVVLVVSAAEGAMPQTFESIAHAQAAKVPIVVALNKVDRPDATEASIQRIMGQLAEKGLNPVAWGGDTEYVRVSALTGQGIQDLLMTLDYQAALLNLKADFGGPAQGTVIEARTEEGRGPVANLLVQHGRLKVGDFVVAGRAFGRVRDITDDRGRQLKEAFPPTPVQISGLDEIPDAGDSFFTTDSLKKAQEAAEQRRAREREAQLAQPKVTLDSLFSQMKDRDTKEILIVLKAAEQGTVDVLKSECEKIATEEVKVRVLYAGVGGITESDVVLAEASRAIVVGFNVIPSGKARSTAEAKGVEIRTYQVIYDLVDDMRKAAEGLLKPELRQEVLGHAEVRKVFKVSRVGAVAGCYVTDGVVQRDALIRVTRNGIVIENDRVLEQLKRFKDDAREVRAGMECGMKIAGYDDIKEGDVLECYRQVEVKRTL